MKKNATSHAEICPQCGCTIQLLVQDYWTYGELAEKFRFSRRSIREWAANGEFGPVEQFIRRGSDVRVPTSGVLFFIKANLYRIDQATAIANEIRGKALTDARLR